MIERKTVSQCPTADYCRGWNDAVDTMPKWISIHDMIPGVGIPVLISDEYGDIYIAQIDSNNTFWKNDVIEGYQTTVDTWFWMPLPEPPEDET